jgi:hypothetical protein
MKMFTALVALLVLLVSSQAVAQQIHNNVIIVFDDSGSMNNTFDSDRTMTRLEAARKSLETVVSTMPSNTRIGILMLNGDYNGRWAWKLEDEPDRQKLLATIRRLSTNGGTPLYRSIKDGMDALLIRRGKTFYGSYRLLVVTDGEETENRGLLDKYLPDMLTRGINIDVIGVDMPSGHTLKEVAEKTSVVTYRSADDPKSLTKEIQAVVSETEQGSDSAEEDFAIVAALPEGFAVDVLQALHNSGNEPIGEIKEVVLDEHGKVQFDENGKPVVREAGEDGGGGLLLSLIGILLFVLVILVLVRLSTSHY